MTATLAEIGTPTDWPSSWGPAPRWATLRSPERATYGPAVARIAEALGKPLFPWQRYVADVALEVDDSGSWVYDEVIVFVQRRSGKTVLVEPITVHRCSQRVKATAWITGQKRDNAVKRWRDSTDVVLASPLAKLVKRNIGKSTEVLWWPATQSKFLPFAPDEDSMHGEDPDLVWVDELWSFTVEQLDLVEAGFRPAWSVKSGQEWKLSAAGTGRSTAMKRDRARGRAAVESGGRSRIAFFEWCVPERVDGRPVAELDDERLLDVVLANHPRRDHGLKRDYLAAELRKGRGPFLRNYGGLDDDGASEDTVIPWQLFERARGERIPVGERVGLGVEVDPLSREASVGAGWRGLDGVARMDLLTTREGTRRVAPLVAGLDPRSVGVVAVNNVGPGRDVADQLEAAGVEVLRVPAGDYAAACRRVSDGIEQDGSVVWTDDEQGHLVAALRGSLWRNLPSGGRVWGASGGAAVTALPAGTLAVWAADHLPEEAAELPPFRIW